MSIVKTSFKGQIVIPKRFRNALHIKPGQRLEICLANDHIEIYPLPQDPIRHFRGILKGDFSLTQELIQERKKDDHEA